MIEWNAPAPGPDPAGSEPLWTSPDLDALNALESTPNSLLYTTDGGLVVVDSGRLGGQLRVFRTSDGTQPHSPTFRTQGETLTLDALYWIDEERLIVATPAADAIPTYDLTTGESTDSGLADFFARDALFSPELNLVVAVFGPLHLWSPDGSGPLERVFPFSPAQREVLNTNGGSAHAALAADGSRLLVGALALTAPPVLPPSISFDLTSERVEPEVFNPDGSLLYSYGAYTVEFSFAGIQVLDPSYEALGPPVPFSFDMTDQGASPDGRFLAIGRTGGMLDLFTSSGEYITSFDMELESPSDGQIVVPSFSQDGSLVAATTVQGTSAVWSTDTFQRLDWLPTRGGWLVGEWYLVGRDGLTERLDPWTGESVGVPLAAGNSGGGRHVLDQTNGRLAAEGLNAVKVFDLESGQQLGRELPLHGGLRMAYTEDGSRLMVPASNGISVWNFDTDTWADIACEVAGRNLTANEWEQFGPRTIEPRSTCPAYPPA